MKKLTVIFLCLLLASVTLGCGKKNGIRATYAAKSTPRFHSPFRSHFKSGFWFCVGP